uniref:Uncharacterized protein n=1 Tax=Aegilops tauschii subsp. strangulata TaxID=200361 RepID=A0A453FGP9_AEGTS
ATHRSQSLHPLLSLSVCPPHLPAPPPLRLSPGSLAGGQVGDPASPPFPLAASRAPPR